MNTNFFNHDNAVFSSGGILVDEENKRILIIRRSDSDEYLLPKGHIDKGESPKVAAQREIFEETGYKNEVNELIRVQVRPDVKEQDKHKIIFWFYAKLTSHEKQKDTQMDNENFVQKWVTLDEAVDLLKWNGDKKLVQAISTRLKDL